MFRRIRSIKMPYKKQGYIYFTCANYEDLSKRRRGQVDRICEEVGGEYAAALKEYLTTGRQAVGIALRHCMRENTLYDMRREFYQKFSHEILRER